MYAGSIRFRSLWTPKLITSSLDLWLDAMDAPTITISSGAVANWTDKSGNNRHASQAAAANRPLFQSTGWNGLPTVSFDGANDFLDLVPFAQTSGQNIIAAVDTLGLFNGDRNFMGRTSPSVNNMALYLGGIGISFRPSVYWNNSFRSVWGAGVQRKAIYRWNFSVGSPSSTTVQIDGLTPVTQTFTASELTNWIGISSLIQPANMKLSELIVLKPGASNALLDRVTGYVAHRWLIKGNLPSNHPFKSFPPRGI